ncbi:MFS transporter [Alicyclobacillus pomorum]|uniref:MFS transporter n=1 Tax=Alicyclobacillus pomorum TaxID=204470 RepID=UPI000418B669|nr:MFS transporter [Alicyclobacillus pomorum]
MSNTWKNYMLTLISFLVGTSQFVIVGILDKVAASVGVSVSAAGQLISVSALANAIGTPVVMVATAKMDRRKRLLLALAIILLGIASTVAFPGFGFLMASYVVLGVGTGVFVVTAYATAANLAPPGRQGRAMSNVSLGFSASQALALALLSIVARTTVVAIPWLMLWAIAAWTFGPTQNFNLLSLAPEACGIVLSLNSSFVQLGFATGAAIGGIAVGGSSITVICWIGAAAVAIALFIATVSFGLTRTFSKRVATK